MLAAYVLVIEFVNIRIDRSTHFNDVSLKSKGGRNKTTLPQCAWHTK